ncbi:MAG: carboxypeptidase regulatory-like domain-containing protein [Euryarchaeota archaeon]|nr:carboxypeptidase regulatory-like domain-containing protein [Euryarchaeota archaeon]
MDSCSRPGRRWLMSLLLLASVSLAQDIPSTPDVTLHGYVLDAAGVPLPWAPVAVRNLRTGEETNEMAGENGLWTALPANLRQGYRPGDTFSITSTIGEHRRETRLTLNATESLPRVENLTFPPGVRPPTPTPTPTPAPPKAAAPGGSPRGGGAPPAGTSPPPPGGPGGAWMVPVVLLGATAAAAAVLWRRR